MFTNRELSKNNNEMIFLIKTGVFILLPLAAIYIFARMYLNYISTRPEKGSITALEIKRLTDQWSIENQDGDVFESLGITEGEYRGMSPDELLILLKERIGELPDPDHTEFV